MFSQWSWQSALSPLRISAHMDLTPFNEKKNLIKVVYEAAANDWDSIIFHILFEVGLSQSWKKTDEIFNQI